MVGVMVVAEGASVRWPLVLSIPLAIISACVVAALTYVIAVGPIIRRDRFSIIWIASTLGVSMMLENGAAFFWGSYTLPFPTLLESTGIHFTGLTISYQDLLAFGLALALGLGFEVVRRHTMIGKAGMAVAFDPDMASAVGINTFSMAVGAFAASGFLAAVAGILLGPTSFANPYMGDTYAVFGFMGFIVSKTNYPLSALYAGIGIGVVAEEANALINANAASWFPFVAVLVLLVARPGWMLADSSRQPRAKRVGRRALDRLVTAHGK